MVSTIWFLFNLLIDLFSARLLPATVGVFPFLLSGFGVAVFFIFAGIADFLFSGCQGEDIKYIPILHQQNVLANSDFIWIQPSAFPVDSVPISFLELSM